MCVLTSVVEKSFDEAAVLEERPYRGYVFKVTVLERRVNEGDGLELHTDEPGEERTLYRSCQVFTVGSRLSQGYPKAIPRLSQDQISGWGQC